MEAKEESVLERARDRGGGKGVKKKKETEVTEHVSSNDKPDGEAF